MITVQKENFLNGFVTSTWPPPLSNWFHTFYAKFTKQSSSFFLAGGAVTRALELQSLTPPDWDFWFPYAQVRTNFWATLPGRKKYCPNKTASNYFNSDIWDCMWWHNPNTQPLALQLIVPKGWNGTARGLFSSFDLTPSMVGVDHLGNLYWEQRALYHINNKLFEQPHAITNVQINQLQKRKQKFINRGYLELHTSLSSSLNHTLPPQQQTKNVKKFATAWNAPQTQKNDNVIEADWEKVCECGVDSTGQGGVHSSWCPKG